MAMGVASAGPLICLLLSWRSGEADLVSPRVGHRLAWISVIGLALGVGTGAISLFLVPERYWDVLRQIPERALWFALAELLFSLVCLLVYACCWACCWKKKWQAPWFGNLIAFASATNLLYHFPPLMIVLGQLASGSARTDSETLDRAALLELFYRPEVIAPWLHFSLAAIAFSGGVALWLFEGAMSDTQPEPSATKHTRSVAGIVFLVSLLQLPTGLWLLTTIPNHSRSAIMGSAPLAGLVFLGAMMVMFMLLGRLLKIALGEFEKGDLKMAFVMICLIVFLMTTSTRISRDHSSISLDSFEEPPLSSSLSSPSFLGSFFTSSKGPPGSLFALIKSP